MRTTAQVLGIIGGVFGILMGILANIIGGVAGALAHRRPMACLILELGAGILGFVAISVIWILPSVLWMSGRC